MFPGVWDLYPAWIFPRGDWYRFFPVDHDTSDSACGFKRAMRIFGPCPGPYHHSHRNLSASDQVSPDTDQPQERPREQLAEQLIEQLAEPVVRAMLFVDEAKLKSPIRGTSGFSAHFESLGPRDDQGRSLRELDLTRRLFRYPLSYLVSSDAFAGLPGALEEQVFRRIWEVVSGKDSSGDFDHLSDVDRTAILEILTGTHTDFSRWLAARDGGR